MIELYNGKDEYISRSELNKRIEVIKSKNDGISLIQINAEEKSSQDIINLIISEDMFSKSKLLLIKRLSQNKEKEDLIKYLQNNINSIPKSNILIFWEESKIASNTKYYKMFDKVYTFDEMNKPSFHKWAKEEVKNYEIIIDTEGLNTLCIRCDYKTERLVQELEKYKLGGIKNINQETVIKETTDTLQEEIWSLIKAINLNEKKIVYSKLEKLISQGTDINFMISMIARNLRIYTQVKYLLEKGQNQSQICSILKIPPFTYFDLKNIASGSSWEKIKYLYEKLSSLDYEIKRGNIDAQSGLLLILNKA